MKSIAIVNQKGGSGKTTFSSLLVKALSERGKSVLAIDLDPQGGLSTIYLGESDKPRKGLFDFLVNKDLDGSIHETQENLFDGKIDVLPSDYRIDKIFLSLSPYALKNLSSLPYDYCILDTPPTVQGITKTGMIFAERILIPTEISIQSKAPSLYTIESILELEKTPEIVFSGWKEPSENQGGYQANLSRDFKNTFSKYLVGNIPRNSSTVSFASEWKKATATHKEGILKALNEILEGKK